MELNGSPTPMELNNPHPPRPVGGVEMRNRLVPHPHVLDKNSWWIKIQKGYLGSEEYQPHTRAPSPGFSDRKIIPHNFWLQKPVGVELVEEASRVPSSSS